MAEIRDFLDPIAVARLDSLEIVARTLVEGFRRLSRGRPKGGVWGCIGRSSMLDLLQVVSYFEINALLYL